MTKQLDKGIKQPFEGRADYLNHQKLAGTFCFIHINKCGGISIENALGIPRQLHDTAHQRRTFLGKERWAKMFKFSIVRHPYSKVCSHYRFRVKTNQSGLGDRHLGLNEWVEASYGKKNERYYNNPLMFAPCFDWLSDENGLILMDFVGRLETIGQDWQTIQQHLNTDAPLRRFNQTAKSENDDTAHLTAESKTILDAHFKKDFEYFGYDPI